MTSKIIVTALVINFIFFGGSAPIMADDTESRIPVAAPIDTDAAGRGGPEAISAVVRLICPSRGSGGTGFVHKSGKIITAAHVVAGCNDIKVIGNNPVELMGSIVSIDSDLDLALVSTTIAASRGALNIADNAQLQLGTQVTTWGFPGGYSGRAPLLSVGYLSGVQNIRRTVSSPFYRQWVVNAAFNAGNSGGPLLHLETGKVIGVVSSKLAPISETTLAILSALEGQRSGMQHSVTLPDGSFSSISEAQLIARVLNDLRGQVQLVIGYAVNLEDLKAFLQKNGIDP